MPHIHNSYPANISMQEVALLTLQLRYLSHWIKEPVDFWMIPRILLRVVYISYMSNQITIISNEISANKQEPIWTYDKLQRADLTYCIARGTSNQEVGLAKKERGERESSKLKDMRFYTYEQPSICKILTRKIFSAVLSLLGTN